MGHEITTLDRVGLLGEQAWHGMGIVIKDELSAVDAGLQFNMFYPIARRSLFWQDETGAYHEVDSHVANVREQDAEGNPFQHLLGIVGADYQICQNRELAEFTDALAQTGKITIESCGSIRGGKRVWFLARGEHFFVGGTDEVFPYILVSNGHDGTQAIRVTPTTIRVVCSNTLHMVIPRDDFSERPDSAAITIRHTGRIADKLEEAKRALAYYGQTLRRNREFFEAMQSRKMDREQALKVFATSYSAFWETATEDELASADKDIQQAAKHRLGRMNKAADVFLARYDAEQRSLGLGDTAWAVFNAMSGYLQHDKGSRGKDNVDRVTRRMEQNLFGINASRTYDVLAQVLSLAS